MPSTQTGRHLVAPAAVLAVCLAVAVPSPAALQSCPLGTLTDGTTVTLCSLTQGTTVLKVAARSDDPDPFGLAGVSFLNLIVDGNLELIEQFGVYDRGFAVFPDMALTSATFNAATRQITVDFSEIESPSGGLLTIHGVFTLSVTGDVSQITEVINVASHTLDLIQGRLYVLSDFDVNGTFNDDTASVNFTTKKITFTDADGVSTGVVEPIGGPAPSALQVSTCCNLSDDLGIDIAIALDGSVAPGPGDLQAAYSWDSNIPGFGTFATTLLETVTLPVPEPSAALLQTTALACLAGVARLRRRRREH